MAIGINDIIQATARLRWGAQLDVQNVFTYAFNAIGTATQDFLRELIAGQISAVYSSINSIMPPEFVYVDVGLFNTTDGAPEPDEPFVGLTAGEGANDSMPPGDSIFMYGRTARAGTRGRKWLPGSGEQQHVDGLWAGGAVAAITVALSEYLTSVNDVATGAQLVPGVRHAPILGAPSFIPFISGASPLSVYNRNTRRQGVGS